MSFQLSSKYIPQGDQHQAIEKLSRSLKAGNRHQTLWGVTGSGKTFTAANIISHVNKPTLVISHNKTLAAQLYSELKQFFPHNAVEYFVSYFDYYQPEAYIPRSDTYIEKDSSINDEIERLRLSTTHSLLTRSDVIVVASVSCIYGLGSPEDFAQMTLTLKRGVEIPRDELLHQLVNMLYERDDWELSRGKFRLRGDILDIYPAHREEEAIRVEFFGDEIERLSSINPLTGESRHECSLFTLFPAKQFVTSGEKLQKALIGIERELTDRLKFLEEESNFLAAQRLKMRTEYDLEMMREVGYCSGVENYSRHLSGRAPGSTPYTLMDFFPENSLTIIDESHTTIPQVGGMYAGDRARKQTLVEHGFRLPSALDNRPLNFEEFMKSNTHLLYISATPGNFELYNSFVGNKNYYSKEQLPIHQLPPPQPNPTEKELDITKKGNPLLVEQIIRPTGLLDPEITLRPLRYQIDETIELCRQRVAQKERVLVTTLTKRTAEDLTEYLRDIGLKVNYIHSDVDTVERVEILRLLREGAYDILVGINLLREGLDLPEVSLVVILDADKEGFLRSKTALIQTAGRAARHIHGHVILFADQKTESIKELLRITQDRRERQISYNKKHGIIPQSVQRPVQESLQTILLPENRTILEERPENEQQLLQALEKEMAEAAAAMEYERAALLRDQIRTLKGSEKSHKRDSTLPRKKTRKL